MKKILIPGISLIIIVVLLVGSVFAMLRMQEKIRAANQSRGAQRDLAIPVQTARVGRSCIDEVLTFNGDIQAMRSVEIMPKISGRLADLGQDGQFLLSEGSRVKKGQQIALIDDREWKAQLANAEAAKSAAEASLAVAEADIFSSEAGLLHAQANYEQQNAALMSAQAAQASALAAKIDREREQTRQHGLLAQQATTQQNYDRAQTAAEQANAEYASAEAAVKAGEAQVRSARAAIKQAEAALERNKAAVQQAQAGLLQAKAKLQEAQINLSETRLYAPMDGVVSQKNVDPGAMVSPTTPIMTIVAMEQVKVLLSVPVNHLGKVRPGETRARVKTVSRPGEHIECLVNKVYPVIELNTRTAQVEIVLDNVSDGYGDCILKPGMYAAVELLMESRQDVLAIAAALPIRNLGKHIVYVADGDKVRAVDAKLGIRFADQVEVLAGLQEKDEIVVVGQHRLTDGAAIRRVEGNNLQLSAEKL
ncbi:MAG: efflux RND transporter periplasmic adaptor subunit [Oligosphaeraceae bacterium]|mgnify:CR=1 FL=1|nr:efflux RND transporter periplasmic adaptor subunit [Oligosphaeraceae bacterium]